MQTHIEELQDALRARDGPMSPAAGSTSTQGGGAEEDRVASLELSPYDVCQKI